jgi:hypothetical protein
MTLRSILVTVDRTAARSELTGDVVLCLAAGVALTLPSPGGSVSARVKAMAAGCSVVCAAGIEDGSGALTAGVLDTTTSAIPLAPGQVIDVLNVQTASSGAQSGWVLGTPIPGLLARTGVHAPVRLATAASLPAYTADAAGVLTADANGALSVDSVAVANGDRILVKDAALGKHNLIYVVTDLGTAGTPYILTPAEDSNAAALLPVGSSVFVQAGSTLAATTKSLTTFAGTYLTDSLTWA